jgi:amino acid transporter
MTLLSLVGALYFMVCGGPYGLEELARKVGFGGAIAVLLATPLVWSAPTALMVAELAAALPEEGGYYAWVRRALGPFWGFQEVWLSLAASLFDMAIYPTIFGSYLARLCPAVGSWSFATGAAVVALGAVYNLAGARAVGQGSVGMTLILIAPFAVLAGLACAAPHRTPSPPIEPLATPDIAGGVLVAMWNYMGWDNSSTIAGEVERPRRTYPVAVVSALGLVALTYIVPMGAMLAAGVDPAGWDTGAWVSAARTFGGPLLAIAVVVGGMISAFGMYSALCLSYSRLPAVLAQDGYFPSLMARRLTSNGAPWVSIVACSLAWTLSLGLSFERLVSMDVLLYGGSLVLEFVALVVLRVREPGLPRPFKIPGGAVAAGVLAAGPTLLLGFALVKTAHESIGNTNSLAVGAAIVLLGPVAYAVARASLPAERRAEE